MARSISSRDGFRPVGGQSSPVETGKTSQNTPPRSWDEPYSMVASLVLQRPFHYSVTRQGAYVMIDRKSIQRSRTRFRTGSSSNTLGRIKRLPPHSILRSAVSSLTIGGLCGERVTPPNETCSAPLRSGSSSPTFFIEVVMVGVLSSGIFCYFSVKCWKMHLTEPLPFCYNSSTKKARLRRTQPILFFKRNCCV